MQKIINRIIEWDVLSRMQKQFIRCWAALRPLLREQRKKNALFLKSPRPRRASTRKNWLLILRIRKFLPEWQDHFLDPPNLGTGHGILSINIRGRRCKVASGSWSLWSH